MKYHYELTKIYLDEEDVHTDSRFFTTLSEDENPVEIDFSGFNTPDEAYQAAEERKQQYSYSDDWQIQVYPEPENMEEEDMLNGHPYPGHETWPD